MIELSFWTGLGPAKKVLNLVSYDQVRHYNSTRYVGGPKPNGLGRARGLGKKCSGLVQMFSFTSKRTWLITRKKKKRTGLKYGNIFWELLLVIRVTSHQSHFWSNRIMTCHQESIKEKTGRCNHKYHSNTQELTTKKTLGDYDSKHHSDFVKHGKRKKKTRENIMPLICRLQDRQWDGKERSWILSTFPLDPAYMIGDPGCIAMFLICRTGSIMKSNFTGNKLQNTTPHSR